MAMKTRYTVIEGEVVSELRGGVKRDYVPDPLGSTVALLDNTQTITDTFQYWPYGESAARTGTTPINFNYVGTYGYFTDDNDRIYVQKRYLNAFKTRWISEDFIYLNDIYNYCGDSPVSYIDYMGLQRESPPLHGRKNGKNIPVFLDPADYFEPKVFGEDIFGCLAQRKCIFKSRGWAHNETIRQYGRANNHIDESNAMLHCLWACYVRKECGISAYRAIVLGHETDDAHYMDEDKNKHNHGWNPVESPMDLHNDEVGRSCYQQDCIKCCKNALNSGKLVWIMPFRKKPV